MNEGMKIIEETMRKVFPDILPLSLFLLALLFLLLFRPRKRREGRLLAIYTLLAVVLFLCPPFAKMIRPFMRHGEVYWRYLWIVPVTAVVAAASAEVTFSVKKVAGRALAGVLLAAAIVLTGTSIYNRDIFKEAPNREKLAPEAVEIVNAIDQNAEKTGNSYKKVVVPNPWIDEVRQIDGTIRHPFVGRLWFPVPEDPDTQFDDFKRIVNGYERDHDGILMSFLDRAKINYIAAKHDYGFDATLKEGGYAPIYENDSFTIYYNPVIEPDE
ncbi:MAG: hypothetical protein VZR02_07095 [Lachnospiraceae bacterium]|nr:hypothetical protein [Lachnospiraceae bacterium]